MRFDAFLSRVALKEESASVHCHPTARAPFMKRAVFPEGSPDSLIATQAINGRTNGRTIWIADAHRDDGKRFVVRADEKLTAFLELESAIRASNGHDRAAVSV